MVFRLGVYGKRKFDLDDDELEFDDEGRFIVYDGRKKIKIEKKEFFDYDYEFDEDNKSEMVSYVIINLKKG